ncbi:MAG: hypothetical protein RMK01_00775 [Thermomicrobium sp.]|nr:hypothetical protein [Thermomicrobium sp.]MDW8058587.1 hypothetical protein [Thermomicrobium sp.]
MTLQDAAVERLERAGFRVARRTSALVFMVHPAYPGVLVRLGTLCVTAERDDREVARQRLDRLDVAALLAAMEERAAGKGVPCDGQ